MLLDKAKLGEEQALSYFFVGLKHEIKMMVRMFNPKTLYEAYSLTKLQEIVRNGPIRSNIGAKRNYNKVLGGSLSPTVSRPNSK